MAGREVTITNPDKVFFPGTGHTKLDLVRYYLAVAEARCAASPAGRWRSSDSSTAPRASLLPEAGARARGPTGSRRSSSSFPSGRTADEIVVRDAAQLAWVINLGCIDLNPHPVRAEDLDHPDELRVDLDPMPGVPGRRSARWRWSPGRCSTTSAWSAGPRRPARAASTSTARIEPRWTFPEVRRAARGPGARGRTPRARPRHQQVVEGGAPRRVPRLQPERQGPHGGVGLLGAAHAGRAGVDAADLGRGAGLRSGGVHASTRCPARSRRSAIPAQGIDEAVGSLEPLLELAERARGAGLRRRALAAALREAGGRGAAGAAVEEKDAAGATSPAVPPRRPRARSAARPGRRRTTAAASRSRAPPPRPRPWRASSAGSAAPAAWSLPGAGRRAGRLDARAQHHLDPDPPEPAQRARARAPAPGGAGGRLRPLAAPLAEKSSLPREVGPRSRGVPGRRPGEGAR